MASSIDLDQDLLSDVALDISDYTGDDGAAPSAPLSVRNNNPGNMRPVGKSTGFDSFDDPQSGLNAMQKDLHLKITGKSPAMKRNFGDDYEPTIANLIHTWAPPSDKNDTGAYVAHVANQMNKDPDSVLTPDDIPALTKAMITHEGGKKAADYFGTGTQYAQADTGTMSDATSPASGTPVTDPDLLAQLEGGSQSGAAVTDPALLAQLEGTDLPGLAGAENILPAAQASTQPAAPQVPFYGTNDQPISQAPLPTDNLMLAGQGTPPPTPDSDYAQAMQDKQNGVGFGQGFVNSLLPDSGLWNRTKADWAARNQRANEIAQSAASGETPTGLEIFQNLTNAGGALVADPIMNLLGSAGRYAGEAVPTLASSLQGAGQEVKEDIAQNPAVQTASNYVQSQPILGRTLQGVNDLAMIAPFAGPLAEGAGALEAGAVNAAKSLPEFVGDESSNGALYKRNPIAQGEVPSAEDLRKNASATYKSLPTDAVAIDAEGTNKFLDDIKKVAPQTRVGQLTAGKNSPLTSLLDRWEGEDGIRNTPLTMAEAQEVDEALGDHIDAEIDKVTGRPTKQGLKLMKVQDSFRQAIDEGGTQGGDQLKLARAQWAQAASMNDIERIINRAQMMDNPQTGIKTGFRTLTSNPNRMKGFTPVEKALINRAANTGIVTDALRAGASRLNTVAALATHGPLAGAATHVLTGAARRGATALQLARAQDIAKAIASRDMPVVRPAVAAEVAPEVPVAPKQITYQPEIVAGQGENAVARPNTPQEQVAAEAERQRRVDLGLTQPPIPEKPATPITGLSPENQELAANIRHPQYGLTYPEALAETDKRPDTFNPNNITPQRQALHTAIADELYGDGAKTKGRRIDIVMGPPGAGKSTSLVRPLLAQHGGIEIDSDLAKEKLPEFDHGLGANQTHKESKWITTEMPNNVMQRAVNAGDNIVHPIVGHDLSKVNKMVDEWRKMGYDVNVHLADIPTEESIKRTIERFGSQGRTIPLSYVKGIGEKPRQVFNQVVKGDKVNDYSHYNTNVPRGERPELVNSGSNRLRESSGGQRRGNNPGATSLDESGGGNSQSQARPSQAEIKAPISEGKPIKVHAHGEDDTAITPTGDEFKVKHAVVSGDDLIASNLDDMRPNPKYPQILQPRDRTSPASRMQVTKFANDLNPRLLMNNPLSSEGAPIISKDGVVESGNGRTLSIKRAMANNTEGAAKYKQALKDAGYNIRGVKNPMLVRIRETPMTDAERIKLSQDSNVRTTLGTSSVEQAAKDASNLSSATLDKFMGGDISQARNRDFVKSALKDMVPDNEQASVFSKEGGLSQEGERRIGGALLHKAYGDEAITRLLTENTDNELTSLGKALTQSAPEWAKMREDVKSGIIPADMDKTSMITDAAKQILEARRAGNPVSDYLRTDDMLKPLSPEAKAFIKFLHRNEKLTQFKSSDTISNFLNDYARMARQTKSGTDLYGNEPMKSSEVLKAAYKKSAGEPNGQNDFFKT